MGNEDFKKEMNEELSRVVTYKKPIVITLSGYPGSGKTDVARTLSTELGIYLLSNDYVRNYFYQFTNDYSEEKRLEIESLVSRINKYRLTKLLLMRKSFVYDRDFSLEEEFIKLERLTKLLQLKLIKIKINSTDEHNLEAISNIIMDYNKIYPFVIGDKVEYLSPFDTTTYYEIKERKPHTIEDDFYDYVIDNNEVNQFKKDTFNIVKSIKKTL
jgi:adenylate kinase family enzyme